MKNFVIVAFILSYATSFGMNNNYQQKAIEDMRRQEAARVQLAINLAKASNSTVSTSLGFGAGPNAQHGIHQHNLTITKTSGAKK